MSGIEVQVTDDGPATFEVVFADRRGEPCELPAGELREYARELEDVVQVQRWLSRYSPSFTLDTYVHLLDGDLGDPLAPEGGNGVATGSHGERADVAGGRCCGFGSLERKAGPGRTGPKRRNGFPSRRSRVRSPSSACTASLWSVMGLRTPAGCGHASAAGPSSRLALEGPVGSPDQGRVRPTSPRGRPWRTGCCRTRRPTRHGTSRGTRRWRTPSGSTIPSRAGR